MIQYIQITNFIYNCPINLKPKLKQPVSLRSTQPASPTSPPITPSPGSPLGLVSAEAARPSSPIGITTRQKVTFPTLSISSKPFFPSFEMRRRHVYPPFQELRFKRQQVIYKIFFLLRNFVIKYFWVVGSSPAGRLSFKKSNILT